MNIEMLQKFCHTDKNRVGLTAPWSNGEYTWASNGHVILRVPRIDNVPENDLSPVISGPIAESFDKEPLGWFRVPSLVVQQSLCPECKGTGKVYVCPECKGVGEVSLSTEFNDYDEQTCLSCKGAQVVPREKWLKMWAAKLDRAVPENEANCDNCEGSGKVWDDKSVQMGTALFSDRYLSWLSMLPNCEIGVISEFGPARIRFDGGDGLIMPRRP